ncbi:hypothetical protein AAC387_Pa02g2579 [Persea americana]
MVEPAALKRGIRTNAARTTRLISTNKIKVKPSSRLTIRASIMDESGKIMLKASNRMIEMRVRNEARRRQMRRKKVVTRRMQEMTEA